MKKSVFESEALKEKIFACEYDNGLKAYVLPKPGYTKKYATYATHYGSIDSEFVVPKEEKSTKVPDGIAHFLEHKLFEQEDGPVMEKFSALGASSNAYTSFDHTAYLFSCSQNFDECFKLLVKFVQNPYLTDESVEKEKGIIGQEIRMYEDNPNWRVFFNYLGALYQNHPVRIDIAGTIESIAKIDKEILYKCYNTFYHPSNMIIFVAGDVEPDKIFDTIANNQKVTESKPEIKRIFPNEPAGIYKNAVEQKMEVATPLFILGFKETDLNIKKDIAIHNAGMNILMEMVFGPSSDLYSELYEEGLITSNFDADYTFEGNYGYSTIGGESKSPEVVRDRIVKKITQLQTKGLNKEDFERIKKMRLGTSVKIFNSVDKIAHAFVANHMKGINLFQLTDSYSNISFETIKEIFDRHFVLDNIALSVVEPLNKNLDA